MAYRSDKTYGGDPGGSPLADADRMRRLRRLQTLAKIMDTAFAIPGTNIRFGADSLLGLVPGVGDFAGAMLGLAIVNEARRLGVPADKMGRMLANIGLDTVVGFVPLLGDVFDMYFKSHRRNVQLILDHFEQDEAIWPPTR
jgi:hypothetical protein